MFYTSVCHSVYGGGQCLPTRGGSTSRGLHYGGSASRGILPPEGDLHLRLLPMEVCIQGGSAYRGAALRVDLPRGLHSGSLPTGDLPPGVSAYRRVCIQGFCLQGVCIQGEGLGRPPGSAYGDVCLQRVVGQSPWNQKSGWYVSNWNAFLYFRMFTLGFFTNAWSWEYMALLQTLFALIFAVFFLLATYDVSKYEIRYQWM